MPTILKILGWRLFFYPNEGNEPIHIHCQKGDAECKIWLFVEHFDIEPQFEYNLTPRDRREIRKIIFEHFDLIVEEWNAWHPNL
jgi:hypothetical protein